MRTSPVFARFIALPCLLALLLAGCTVGCVSSHQQFAPGQYDITLKADQPSDGSTYVLVGQFAVNAKPVGLDLLNPGIAANAAYQQGTNQTQQMTDPEATAKAPEPKPEPDPEPPTPSAAPPAKTATETASGAAPNAPAASPADSATEATPAADTSGGG
jgi:hypothetical protein